MKLKEIGEFNFIHCIADDTVNDVHTLRVGIGDDCGVYYGTPDYDQLISTDAMVEDIHFSFRYMSPYDVGYRLMTANISDIAAMGGIPRQVVLSIAANDTVDVHVLQDIYNGIKHQCKQFHINIIGGDTVRTTGPLVVTVTIIGEVPKGTAVLRSGARVGDIVGVTHYIGVSATGLEALQHSLPGYPVTTMGHKRPEPQIDLGVQLRQLGAHSLNDISDGLSSELNEIAKASNVTIRIEESLIPLHEETYAMARERNTNPIDYALYGGEDFQLLFTAPSSCKDQISHLKGVTFIGEVIGTTPGVEMVTHDKQILKLEGKGYNHFHE